MQTANSQAADAHTPIPQMAAPAARAQQGGWTIVALLFFFMVINFADKVIIGLAAVPMMRDLNLTPKEFGLINSSFFFLFSLSAVVTGFLVNRIPTRWALLVMGLVWALTQFPMIGQVGFVTVLLCRVMLGAGEGPAFPVALHATYKWFPDSLRTLPTAIISQGAAIGVVVSIPILNYVIGNYTWHWAFGLLGVIGLLWTIAWALLGKEGAIEVASEAAPQNPNDRIPYSQLLLNPTTLSGFAAYFGAYWGLSLLIAWFTPFLIQGLGFSQKDAGWITTLPWATSPLIIIGAGWFSQRLLSAGVSTRWARGVFGGACVAIGGLALILMPMMPNAGLKIAMMVIGITVPAVIYVVTYAILGEFTPAGQRGAVLAIMSAVGSSSGLIAPYAMGSFVQNATERGATAADGYLQGFLICGVIALIGGVLGMLFLRPEREVARFAAQRR